MIDSLSETLLTLAQAADELPRLVSYTSVFEESPQPIYRYVVRAFIDINDREITRTATGSEVLFAGLWANINTLKSLENIGLCWIEEGESVTDNSLSVLTPTIRAAGSEIWISLNPDAPDAPAMQFCDGSRPDARHVHVPAGLQRHAAVAADARAQAAASAALRAQRPRPRRRPPCLRHCAASTTAPG